MKKDTVQGKVFSRKRPFKMLFGCPFLYPRRRGASYCLSFLFADAEGLPFPKQACYRTAGLYRAPFGVHASLGECCST